MPKVTKKAKTVSLLEAAMMGNITASMSELEIAGAPAKKTAKTKKANKQTLSKAATIVLKAEKAVYKDLVSPKKRKKTGLLGAAARGAASPPMGKSELGKSAAEKEVKGKKAM